MGTVVQHTDFEYADGSRPGFMTAKIVRTGTSESLFPDLVTQYAADARGNRVEEAVGSGDTVLMTSHTYDQNGNRTSTTDPNGNTTHFTYDGFNRLIRTTHPATSSKKRSGSGAGSFEFKTATTDIHYDGRGLKVETVDENLVSTLYEYDELKRLVQTRRKMETAAEDIINDIGYNRLGSQTTLVDPNGNPTFNSYDSMQRLTASSTFGTVDGGATPELITTRYGYEDEGFDPLNSPFANNVGSSVFNTAGFLAQRVTDPRGICDLL